MVLVMAAHGSNLVRRLQSPPQASAESDEVRISSLKRHGYKGSHSPGWSRPRNEEVHVKETCHGKELLTQDVAAAAHQLWSQYSNGAPRCHLTPGRTPRSVASTSPRTTARSSFSALPDLHTQAIASSKTLETELAVMSGLIAEVSLRKTATTEADSATICPSSSSRGQPQTLRASSVVIGSSSRQAVSGEPAAAEAAHGRRLSAPVGARHRQQKRDEVSQHLEEVQSMYRRVSLALTSTENLITGLQELRAHRNRKSVGENDSRPSLSPRSVCSRREAAQCRPDNRITALQRSLCIRMKDSEELCKEAQGVCHRVLHALMLAKEAGDVDRTAVHQSELAIIDGSSSARGVGRRKSFSPPNRRCRKSGMD